MEQKTIKVVRRYKDEYQAICPFHDDNTPSLFINLNKGVYKCFGCNKSGSTTSLLRELKLENAEIEPFKYISAKEFGEDTEGWRYMINRGFLSGTLDEFCVTCSDRYVLIPLKKRSGTSVGLIYRNFIEGLPKYMFSKGFKAHDYLYGVYNYEPDYLTNEVIIVEGPLDVMWLNQAGFRNSIAIMGTAISEEQIRKLKYLSTSICLLLDSDEAGVKGAKKAGRQLLDKGMQVSVLSLPKEVLDVKRLQPMEIKYFWKSKKKNYLKELLINV